MSRSILDTDAELNKRVSELTAIMDEHPWSSTFKRHKLKELIREVQQEAGDRAVLMLQEALVRDWTEAEPKPAREVRAITAA